MMMDYSKLFVLTVLTFLVMSCQHEETDIPQEKKCQEALNSDWEILPSVTTYPLTNVSFYDDKNGVVSGGLTTILTTKDGGISWQNGSVERSQSFHHSYILNEDEIFVGRLGLYKSTDGGNSFAEIGNLNSNGLSTFNIHFFNSEKGLIYTAQDILGTEDGGVSWSTKLEGGTTADEFFFVSDDVGFIAGGSTTGGIVGGIFSEGKIHKTLDKGDSWELIHTDDWEIMSIYFISEDFGYYTNINGELFSTKNGGLEWELVNGELPTSVYDMVYLDSCNGYIAGNDAIYKTLDGGVNWKIDFEDERDILSIDIKPDNTLIAVGREGLMVTKK